MAYSNSYLPYFSDDIKKNSNPSYILIYDPVSFEIDLPSSSNTIVLDPGNFVSESITSSTFTQDSNGGITYIGTDINRYYNISYVINFQISSGLTDFINFYIYINGVQKTPSTQIVEGLVNQLSSNSGNLITTLHQNDVIVLFAAGYPSSPTINVFNYSLLITAIN